MSIKKTFASVALPLLPLSQDMNAEPNASASINKRMLCFFILKLLRHVKIKNALIPVVNVGEHVTMRVKIITEITVSIFIGIILPIRNAISVFYTI